MAALASMIKIAGAGVAAANGTFWAKSPSIIPVGFSKVCKENAWNAEKTWSTLTDLETQWYLNDNGAYVYYNKGDGKWWIDAPEGHGLYIAKADGKHKGIPPANGWQLLDHSYGPIPAVRMVKEYQ